MTIAQQRRQIIRHAFLLFFISLFLGIPVGGAPNARQWLTAHLGNLLTSILLIGAGSVWHEMRLDDGQRRRARIALFLAVWVGLALSLFNAIFGMPGPISTPGLQAPSWVVGVSLAVTAIVVPATFYLAWIFWRGMRGDPIT